MPTQPQQIIQISSSVQNTTVTNEFQSYNFESCTYDLGINQPQLGMPVAEGNQAVDQATDLYQAIGIAGGNPDIAMIYPEISGAIPPLSRPPGVKDEHVEMLLKKYATGTAEPRSQIHWDDVSQWAKMVLGETCNIVYHEMDIGDGVAQFFWDLTGIDGFDGNVVVKVRVETRASADGKLDYQRSSRVASDDFIFTLVGVSMYLGPNYEALDNIWTPAPFGNHAKHALQHAPHIPRGQVLLVSGNSLIEISGGSSSAALEPVIHKLLAHTTVHAPTSLHIPHVSQYSFEIPEANKGPNSPNEVKGLCTPFKVKYHVDVLIVAASAYAEEHGILLDGNCSIERDEVNKTSTVTCKLVTRRVGVHDINLVFEEALTMNTGSKKIQVKVLGG